MDINKNKRFAFNNGRSMTIGQSTLVINRSSISTTTVGGHTPTPPRSLKTPLQADDIQQNLNSESRKRRKYEPLQTNIWFHESRTSEEDVIVDLQFLPGMREGDIAELEPLEGLNKKLYFVVKNFSDNRKNSKFSVSLLSGALQTLMDLSPRSTALIRLKEKEEVQADLVEVYIKDMHLSRDDMWLFSSKLVGTCIYKNKKVIFPNNIRGSVDQIYRSGKKVFSAFIGNDTKVVFRSESARLVFMLQISREMWHFEESGEIMFQKLINGLFPAIFQKWLEIGTHHLLTIVLFTSMDLTNIPWNKLQQGEKPSQRRDYFRVVVDQVNIADWDKIMASLRLEFKNFMQEINLTVKDGKSVIEGGILPSVKGNILEAINLGTTLVMDRFKNTDLKHTTHHFIVISPGTGLYDVDYDLMVSTSRKILSLDVALDIICLSQPPLHVVPLLRFRDQRNKLSHCIPSWCDISFWNDFSQISNQWIPRCKIYELQMMGVMETEMNDVSIENLEIVQNSKSVMDAIEGYDEDVFKPFDFYEEKEMFNNEKLSFGDKTLKNKSSTLSFLISLFRTSTIKVDPSTITSPIFGEVTNSRSDVSALSTLYTLTKSDDHAGSISGKASSIKSLQSNDSESVSTDQKSEIPKMTSSERKNEIFKQAKESVNKRPNVSKFEAYFERKRSSNMNLESDGPVNQLWTEIENPSKEAKSVMHGFFNYSRWMDVFPKKVKRRQVKWRSLASPAALPLSTPVFPTLHELQTEYTFQSYDVVINWENELELKTSDLLCGMISLRLHLGFQICVGPKVKEVESKRKSDGNADALIKYLPKNSYGSRIYLSLDNKIHRIACDYNGNVNVQLYHQSEKSDGRGLNQYFPNIRTRYDEEYSPAVIDTLNEKPKEYNWNQLDQLIAGYDDAMADDKKSFHRMKFVLLPAEIPNSSYKSSPEGERLTTEEIRLDGISRLVAAIYRGKFCPPSKQNGKQNGEEIVSDISFYTGNLYEFMSREAEKYMTAYEQKDAFIHSENRFTKGIQLIILASEMQGPNGIKFVDRTWHFKTHPHCFLGTDFVSWLIENFEGINTREEAVDFGDSLKNRALFKHVENRHGFLDGHYFYELSDEYIDRTRFDKGKEKERDFNTTGWFARKSVGDSHNSSNAKTRSVDSSQLKSPIGSDTDSINTKNSGNILSPQPTQDLSSSRRTNSQSLKGSISSSIPNSQQDAYSLETPTAEKKKVILSRSVLFDLDPSKSSQRPEIIKVHYDRVHNPEHCFHIRFEWLNTTAKMIDDLISNWSRLCERHGLKLVETPWEELCTIPTRNPFHSFIELKLILDPWTDDQFCDDVSKNILRENNFYYHMYFLHQSGFMLDNRASLFFQKENVEIEYSWGKPSFKYAQYVHLTGAYIAEIRDNGEFFLAPNNIHITRVNNSASVNDQGKSSFLDSQKIMLRFREDCNDKNKLREIFTQAKNNWKSNSN